ncbi:hypothetical protein [Paraferrimonas sedimenticola]|uniref:Uncharacterized protein n=1 Tax=Paraferrimonas sedimenticola TaxID=375674 RepID=A0AA37RS09_9GAMM|nr:hypothetical protein [Paraferrimonas sedimenticola]GLP94980.1 hypothetical protein GCM10007895_02860 [Paraferrimonas sedimenticola]
MQSLLEHLEQTNVWLERNFLNQDLPEEPEAYLLELQKHLAVRSNCLNELVSQGILDEQLAEHMAFNKALSEWAVKQKMASAAALHRLKKGANTQKAYQAVANAR